MWRSLLTLSALVVSAPLFALEVPQAPHLVVSGYAEQKAEPDMLTLNVAVTALEKQGIKAKQQVDSKVAAFFVSWKGWASSAAMWKRVTW